MYSIAVAASLKNIMEIAPQMQEQCNVTFLTYTSNDNLVYIYQQNVNQFDALLFGGSYTYNILLERVGSISKPCAFFNIADRDYYRVIAQLAIQEPGVDFSRVFFDQPDQPVDLEPVLGEKGLSIVEEIDPSVTFGDYWNQGLNRYRELWQSGQADWIVSRFGSMEEQLQKEGIRYKLLLPSKESMLDTFYGLLLRLQEKAPRGGATGIGMLRPHSSSQPPDGRGIFGVPSRPPCGADRERPHPVGGHPPVHQQPPAALFEKAAGFPLCHRLGLRRGRDCRPPRGQPGAEKRPEPAGLVGVSGDGGRLPDRPSGRGENRGAHCGAAPAGVDVPSASPVCAPVGGSL